MICTAADFISFQTPTQRCYTFNGKANRIRNGSLYSTTDNGDDGILLLRLYSHTNQYIPASLESTAIFCSSSSNVDCVSLCVGIGFMVSIHDNREMPIIGTKAMLIGGGRIYRLSYSKKMHHSLGSPYTPCTDVTPPMLQAAFDKISDTDYSHGEYICSIVCYQVHM